MLGVNRIDLYINYDQPLNKAETDHYRELIRRRGSLEPVAYILGRAYFHNLTLKVDRSVLIPRPETEHLVEAAVSFLNQGDWTRPPAVLDVGTGSGAIAIAIAAAWPDAVLTAADSSSRALEVARENARIAAVASRIDFIESDLFGGLGDNAMFDLIVSNPPYIADDEWDDLPEDVRLFEPEAALRGGPDGLDYYRLLADNAPRHLNPGGCLILEIGWRQGGAVKVLLETQGYLEPVWLEKDYSGHDRVVVARMM